MEEAPMQMSFSVHVAPSRCASSFQRRHQLPISKFKISPEFTYELVEAFGVRSINLLAIDTCRDCTVTFGPCQETWPNVTIHEVPKTKPSSNVTRRNLAKKCDNNDESLQNIEGSLAKTPCKPRLAMGKPRLGVGFHHSPRLGMVLQELTTKKSRLASLLPNMMCPSFVPSLPHQNKAMFGPSSKLGLDVSHQDQGPCFIPF
ncbi:hypothetical protein PIB30_011850 [Stylosanthes scabra]|uniref:Uncharacterized protein n=1 Tax=Stylosanthes scabra TaxID=79078 RepID=A0ABU6T5Q3_9FABA|nr:hypothetical protein [Stylosanthes scabra]